MIYALDSNAIVHFLHSNSNICYNFEKAIIYGCKIVVPEICDYEIRRGFYIKPNPRREAYFNILMENCDIVAINSGTWNYAMSVYAGHYHNRHAADEMDILIAALCIQYGYTLVTNNTKDFKNVKGLNFVDWTQ